MGIWLSNLHALNEGQMYESIYNTFIIDTQLYLVNLERGWSQLYFEYRQLISVTYKKEIFLNLNKLEAKL